MIQILISAIVVEAIVEIIVDSEIFFNLRNYLVKKNPWFLGELFNCGYCMSVWISMPFAILIEQPIIGNLYVDIIIRWMLLHRLSNMIHELFKRWLSRYPFVLLHQQVKIDAEEYKSSEDEKPSSDNSKS